MKDLETISERLIPVRGGIVPDWAAEKKGPPEGEVVTATFDTDETVEVSVHQKPLEGLKIKRFLEMVEAGEKPGAAAKRLGTTVTQIMEEQGVRPAVKALLEQFGFNNAVRKEMVRAALNKIMMENVDSGTKGQKLAIAAAKEIAKDPDVGLNAPPSTIGVQIDMTAFAKLARNVEPLEGLENLLEGRQENI